MARDGKVSTASSQSRLKFYSARPEFYASLNGIKFQLVYIYLQLEKCTVAMLKDFAKSRKISAGTRKADLVDAIREYLEL